MKHDVRFSLELPEELVTQSAKTVLKDIEHQLTDVHAHCGTMISDNVLTISLTVDPPVGIEPQLYAATSVMAAALVSGMRHASRIKNVASFAIGSTN